MTTTPPKPLKVWDFPERDCCNPGAARGEWEWLAMWAGAEGLAGKVYAVRTLDPDEAGRVKPSYAVYEGQAPEGRRDVKAL